MYGFLLFVVLVIVLWREARPDDNQVRVGSYRTNYFDSDSKRLIQEMERNRVGDQSLEEFAMMQDQLRKYERESVYGVPQSGRLREAMELSLQIKKRFVGYDFRRHQVYIKQITLPHLQIDPELKC